MDVYQRILALLNSGEWVYSNYYGEMVVKAELQDNSLLIRTAHDLIVIKIKLEPDQVFFSGDPCLVFDMYGNAHVDMKIKRLLTFNRHAFFHQKRWARECRERATAVLRNQLTKFIGKTATDVSADNDDDGTSLCLLFGDEKLSIRSSADDPYADEGASFYIGDFRFPDGHRQFLEIGEEVLKGELEAGRSAYMQSFYKRH